jgi:hypothetical protein
LTVVSRLQITRHPPVDGAVACALDNAAVKSFFSTREHELLSRQRFATKDA